MIEGKEELIGGQLNDKSYISAFRLGTYIATERPVFPLKYISQQEMRRTFYLLQSFDTSNICIPQEQVQKIVFEKYDDYKYSYEKYGLGLINRF